MEEVFQWASFLSSLFTIAASAIAIYLFLSKGKTISKVFDLLVNYTYQLTLSELKEKLEKLNEYNANEPADKEKIINILNEIMGQIKGNDSLKLHFTATLDLIRKYNKDKQYLTEPRKRAFVSELREKLRNLNVRNIDDLVGS